MLGVLSLGVAYLCLQLVLPFAAPLTWAVTLAVIAHPLYVALRRRVRRSAPAAALAALIVTLAVTAAVVWVGSVLVREAGGALDTARTFIDERRWNVVAERFPSLAPLADWVEGTAADEEARRGAFTRAAGWVRGFATGLVDVAIGAVLTVYFLFFFFRDDERLLRALPHFVPLSRGDAHDVLLDIRNAIQAMVWGTLGVAAIQGALGGLMFWWLGLPAPVVWGAVMALLSVLPMFGAALVWAPVALYLALTGELGSAAILTLWGALVIGLVDNFVKPLVVKDKLRLHTVPVFIAILGGVYAFGATGVVLGPVVLATAIGLLDVWRRQLRRRDAGADAR